jgi:hypothetical protein
MKFRGYFHPAYNPRTVGFNKQGGEFWIGWINDKDESEGLVRIELTIPADDSPSQSTFAVIHVHADGVTVIRQLEKVGFLKMFEEIHASTFYDVVQCCSRCDIPIIYHGDYGNELVSREIWEVLYSGGMGAS